MRHVRSLALTLMAVAFVACDRDDRPLLTTFYPTYGYLDEAGEKWTIPVRVWVRSPHAKTQGALTTVASISSDEREHMVFEGRIADLVADSRSEQDVRFVFDEDPKEEVFRIAMDPDVAAERDQWPLSDLNGIVEGRLRLPRARAEELLRAQGSTGWLTLRELSPGKDSVGRVLLIPPDGHSVVSDIDDTVKVTEIPAGPKVVFRNTFLREFVPAPRMVERYQALAAEGSVFHFVSGGPWQLHGPLSTFLSAAGFPEATFHMKEAPKNLLTLTTWERLHMLAQGNATFEQKVEQISELLERFPRRRFTLIGDSGEKDPEVFRTIRDRFGDRVAKIYIRHVLPGPPGERLAGMDVINPDGSDSMSHLPAGPMLAGQPPR